MVGDCCSIGEIEYRLDIGGKLFIGNWFRFYEPRDLCFDIFVDVPSCSKLLLSRIPSRYFRKFTDTFYRPRTKHTIGLIGPRWIIALSSPLGVRFFWTEKCYHQKSLACLLELLLLSLPTVSVLAIHCITFIHAWNSPVHYTFDAQNIVKYHIFNSKNCVLLPIPHHHHQQIKSSLNHQSWIIIPTIVVSLLTLPFQMQYPMHSPKAIQHMAIHLLKCHRSLTQPPPLSMINHHPPLYLHQPQQHVRIIPSDVGRKLKINN